MNFLNEMLIFVLRIVNGLFYKIHVPFCSLVTHIKLKTNRVISGDGLKSYGIPVIHVKKGGEFKIGNDLTLNNGRFYNQIGRQQSCYFIVGEKAKLIIGNNVGISATAIVCMHQVTIENNVKIGGNTVIYDTDFHSILPQERIDVIQDQERTNRKPVIIKNNAFIGAHTIILKGVSIGKNAVIGAGSVVSKDIPENEIWAGNPAKFIRRIINE